MSQDQSAVPAPRAGTSRRTVARGLAWAVPVVAVGAAAPAFAASRRVTVQGACTQTNTSPESNRGTITVTVSPGLLAGESLAVMFSRTGTAATDVPNATITPPTTLVSPNTPQTIGTQQSRSFVISGPGSVYTFSITNLNPSRVGGTNNSMTTITANVTGNGSTTIVTGSDTLGNLMITRTGASPNFSCATNN